MKAIILAAGQSERFGGALPKQLLKLGELTLIEHVIHAVCRLDVDEVIIVTNRDNDNALRQALLPVMEHQTLGLATEKCMTSPLEGEVEKIGIFSGEGISIKFIISDNAHLGNGASFFDGLQHIADDCYVLMSDHVFSNETIDQIAKKVQANLDQGLPMLACDPNIAQIFDLDDATKVLGSGAHIQKIGKDLIKYDLIDMGVFYFPRSAHQLVRQAFGQKAYSLTDIVRYIIDQDQFGFLEIQGAQWQDVDDDAMLAYSRAAAWLL